MDVNEIPQEQTGNFPTGVSEHKYTTLNEMNAFITGVNLAQDTDVTVGDVFERDNLFVVRVKVGEWGEE